jgi:hypothetical protein
MVEEADPRFVAARGVLCWKYGIERKESTHKFFSKENA